ncbi:hypothetical protein K440DRAFT_227628 [Wilcoxina mikolae CBS 423.85]|nr:hypothetical protein K440DRAFT_227628 [Wilcoxina mikolae CBS 423.85]
MHDFLTVVAVTVDDSLNAFAIGEACPSSVSPLPFFSPILPIVFFTPPTLPILAFCIVRLLLSNAGWSLSDTGGCIEARVALCPPILPMVLLGAGGFARVIASSLLFVAAGVGSDFLSSTVLFSGGGGGGAVKDMLPSRSSSSVSSSAPPGFVALL